jgi:hypothetical protein
MRWAQVALFTLLSGLLAAAAPAAGSPDPRGQHDSDWRQPDDSRDHRRGRGYDDEQAPDLAVGFFYDELSPYGEWVMHPHYGWAWFPRHVRAGWRPYSLGRWVESDYGWTWVSAERFGWATYHYGRWAWDPELGWLWVPGTVWGPAWVSWQHGHGYVGWAPLPPTVGWDFRIGIAMGGTTLSFGIEPRDYVFVEERRFLAPQVVSYIMPPARNITIINSTTNVTNYTVAGDRVINNGVPIDRIERATGTRAPRLRVTTAPTTGTAGLQGNVVRVYRPAEAKLRTVRSAERNNAGLPESAPAPTRNEAGPPASAPNLAPSPRGRPAPVAIPVAPRVRPVPRANDEGQFLREQKELKATAEKQRRTLEQIQRQEMAQARAKADAQEVAQRHAAELKADQEQRQHAERQLQTRQQVQRQAAEVSRANAPRPEKRAVPPSRPKAEKKDKGEKPSK